MERIQKNNTSMDYNTDQTIKKTRGRPRKYLTEEERIQQCRIAHKISNHEMYINNKPFKELRYNIDNPPLCLEKLLKIIYKDNWTPELQIHLDQFTKQLPPLK